MSGERERFRNEQNNVWLEVDGDRVEGYAEELVTCWVEWGGWHWQATHSERMRAVGRLQDRLSNKNPFMGVGWGYAGYLLSERPLAESIPEATRRRMVEYDEARKRWDEEEYRLMSGG
jgi:hypothetical protein